MKKIIFLLALAIFLTGCSQVTPKQPIEPVLDSPNSDIEPEQNHTPTPEVKDPEEDLDFIPLTKTDLQKPDITEENIENKIEDVITLVVEKKTYTNPYKKTSVYNFMRDLTAKSIQPFYFETREYPGIGYFVESINGKKQSTKEKTYWIYYINGKSAQVGISDYLIQPNDIIEWKYESTTL